MAGKKKLSKEELTRRLDSLLSVDGGRDVTEIQRLMHDLQVHHIELELQNNELREAQVALEESRDRYVDLYDFAPVGYATFDLKGVILEINLTAASMLGIERSRLVGKPFAVYTTDTNAFLSHLHACKQDGDRNFVELVFKTKDSGKIAVQLISRPIGCGDDMLIRTSLTDISERKRMEEKQSRQLAELERFNRLMVGRELRIGELRGENKNLKEEIAELISSISG
jgi:PAS domain S-box-containing protein